MVHEPTRKLIVASDDGQAASSSTRRRCWRRPGPASRFSTSGRARRGAGLQAASTATTSRSIGDNHKLLVFPAGRVAGDDPRARRQAAELRQGRPADRRAGVERSSEGLSLDPGRRAHPHRDRPRQLARQAGAGGPAWRRAASRAMTSSPELILHQYDFSNYAEKARVALGYKGLAWRAVTIPPVAPKPDLTPLTGGYRRTPVLQVGADIYCDTTADPVRVAAALSGHRRSAFTAEARAIAFWAERQLFRPMSLYVSGSNLDLLPQGPAGRPQSDARLAGTGRRDGTAGGTAQRAGGACPDRLGRAEMLSATGETGFVASAVSVADFAVYHALWFLTARSDRLAHELAPYDAVNAWMARMRAFGHGQPTPMAATEALDMAAASEPASPRLSEPYDEDPPPGSQVRVRADDYARDPIDGELVLIDRDEIAVRRDDPRVGEVVVHFPRLGYDLRPAR